MNELHGNLLSASIHPPRVVVLQDPAIARSLWTSAGQARASTYLAPPSARAEVTIAIRDGVPSIFVIGPRGAASWKSTHGLSATATLNLRPGVLQSAFGIAARELRDSAVSVTELLPRRIVARSLAIAAESTVGEAALAFAREIAGKARPSLRAEAALSFAAAGPNEIAQRLGVSARTLRRLLGDELGVTPRELGRFARGARLLALLARRTRSLADIANECGYADQAHMSNDTRRLFGRSPTALAEEASSAIIGGWH